MSLCEPWLRTQALTKWHICYLAAVNFSHMVPLLHWSQTSAFLIFFFMWCKIFSSMWILQMLTLLKALHLRQNKICPDFESSEIATWLIVMLCMCLNNTLVLIRNKPEKLIMDNLIVFLILYVVMEIQNCELVFLKVTWLESCK